MKLRARWVGRLPDVGDVLRSPGPRARCAYVIVGVTIVQRMSISCLDYDSTRGDPMFVALARGPITRTETRCVFEVARIGLDELPTGATVHAWTWDKRDRRPA